MSTDLLRITISEPAKPEPKKIEVKEPALAVPRPIKPLDGPPIFGVRVGLVPPDYAMAPSPYDRRCSEGDVANSYVPADQASLQIIEN